ncbi:hypothetical protein BH09PLA1_BH09PLA1_12340 [soil metagenome]
MSRTSTRSRAASIARTCALTVAASTTLSLTGAPVDAAPRTWDNTFTDDTWNDASHWQGGTAPQNGDDVILQQSDNIDRTVRYGNPPGVTLNSLTIESTGTGVMTLSQTAHQLDVLSLRMGLVGTGAYNLSGGTLNSAQTFIGVNGVGSFTQSGGRHNASVFVSLGDGSLGFGSYVLGDGTFTANELDVGYSGTGTFGQGGGALTVNTFLALGTVEGGRGTYNMIASGSINAASEYIGLLGAGTFIQAAGSNTVAEVFSIGENIGSIGTYTIGGSATLTAPEFDVGFAGQGAFFQNGGSVTSPNINLAARAGSTGTYTMTAGSIVANGAPGDPGDIIVGIDSGSAASFGQSGGSVTSSGYISIAYSTGSRGSWVLDGGSISANRVQVAGSPTAAGGIGTFTQNNGTLNATGGVKVWNRGIYRFNGGAFTANALEVVGSKFIIGAASGRTARVNSVAITAGGRVDINDNKMIIDYSGPTPIGNVATPGTITNYIATARNTGVSGHWSGPGITSSVANGTLFSVGVAEASQVFNISGVQTASFGGQTVDATSVLVKFTYYGDTDLNGIVNFDDYSRTDQGFLNSRQGWFNGDFDYNGVVNFDDYSLIDFAFNTQSVTLGRAVKFLDGTDRSERGMDTPALSKVLEHYQQFGDAYANAFLSAVPEPTGITVIGLAVAGMVRRRRR